jgi:hypothetical protein
MSLAKVLGVPVPAEDIKSNQGNAYVRGHYVIRTANRIFGHMGWEIRILDTQLVQNEFKQGSRDEQWYIGYNMTVRLTATYEGETKTTEDVGFGQGINKDLGKAHEGAIKEARTDAMKRCLKDLGDAFGLHLYDGGSTVVPNDPNAHPLLPDDKKVLVAAVKGSILSREEKVELDNQLRLRYPNDGSQSKEALDWALLQISEEEMAEVARQEEFGQ